MKTPAAPFCYNAMMKKFLLQTSFAFLFFISACAGEPAATQEDTASTATTILEEDPCAPQSLPNTVQPVNDLMRKFDDASQLAANLPAQQLADVISNLQRIRRDTEDVQIPACLTTLKTH